jgi:hypothetical protein
LNYYKKKTKYTFNNLRKKSKIEFKWIDASSQAPATAPQTAAELTHHNHYHQSHRHIYSLESPTTTSSPPTTSTTNPQHLHTSHPHLSATLTSANAANTGSGPPRIRTSPDGNLNAATANFYNNHYATPDHKGLYQIVLSYVPKVN